MPMTLRDLILLSGTMALLGGCGTTASRPFKGHEEAFNERVAGNRIRPDLVPLIKGIEYPPLLPPALRHKVSVASTFSRPALITELDFTQIQEQISRVPSLYDYTIVWIHKGASIETQVDVCLPPYLVTVEKKAGCGWQVYRVSLAPSP